MTKLRIIKSLNDDKVWPPYFKRARQKEVAHSYHGCIRTNSISPCYTQGAPCCPDPGNTSPKHASILFLNDKAMPDSLYFPLDLMLCLVNKFNFWSNDQRMLYAVNWISAFQRRQYRLRAAALSQGQPLQNLHFPFLWLYFSVSNSSFNPNQVADILYCDLFLNTRSLAPSHLNSITQSYKFLLT